MTRRSIVVPIVAAAAIFGSVASVRADRRPIEARWRVEQARLQRKGVAVPRYVVAIGDVVPATLEVDPADRPLFRASTVTLEVDRRLAAHRDDATEKALPGGGVALWLTALEAGVSRVTVRVEGPGMKLSFDLDVEVVEHARDVRADSPPPAEVPLPADPGPVAESRGVAAPAAVPANYAWIHGVVASYDHPAEDRRYMLRGVKVELFQVGNPVALATRNTSDELGEGDYGLDREDYVKTSTNTWYRVSDTGLYDFGNVYVGAAGISLQVKVTFQYYSQATGTSSAGFLRASVTDADSGDAQLSRTWSLGTANSTEEIWSGLYIPALASGNGTLSDEATHCLLDHARFHRYIRVATGYDAPHVGFHVQLSDVGSPFTSNSNGDVYVASWDNGYLWYPYTDSLRHEYTHALHHDMRGGNFPSYPAGDVNHGNCANTGSGDALVEGWARFLPPFIFKDGTYHWTASSTADLTTAPLDYCASPTPDANHEWAFGRGMYQGWTRSGSGNGYVNCTTDRIRIDDPDTVEAAFASMITNCVYDCDLWAGFNDHGMDFDITAPTNPTAMSVSPSTTWINDDTPTWSWTAGTDDMSCLDGYGIFLTSTSSQPGSTKDIEGVTSYTPPALADGTWYLNLRSVDNSGNWAASWSSDGPVRIDTVIPGPVSNLQSTSHTTGVWSNVADLAMAWSLAADNASGVDGYGKNLTSGSPAIPATTKDIENVSTTIETLGSSTLGRYFMLRSVDNAGNWDDGYVSAGPYYVDVTDPANVTNLTSTSHTPSTWSTDTTVDFTWTAAADAHSGIDGYGIFWSTAVGEPSNVKDIEEVTGYTQAGSSSSSGQYFNLKSKDVAGNWPTVWASAGPYYIDAVLPSAPTGLSSVSNPIGSCVSDDPIVSMSWTAAGDIHSGLFGYSRSVSNDAAGTPDTTIDLASGSTATNVTLSPLSNPRWFNLRARDAAGNWSTVASYGPFTVTATPVEVTPMGAQKSAGETRLSWSAVSLASNYRVERSTSPTFAAPDLYTTGGTAWVDAGPAPGSLYFFRVRALNACGTAGP